MGQIWVIWVGHVESLPVCGTSLSTVYRSVFGANWECICLWGMFSLPVYGTKACLWGTAVYLFMGQVKNLPVCEAQQSTCAWGKYACLWGTRVYLLWGKLSLPVWGSTVYLCMGQACLSVRHSSLAVVGEVKSLPVCEAQQSGASLLWGTTVCLFVVQVKSHLPVRWGKLDQSACL